MSDVCMVLFEPIDNISLTSAADHAKRLTWLELLWHPSRESEVDWAHWVAALEAASVFGQLPTIRSSLQSCQRSRAVAFGLKARLARFLSDEPTMRSLAQSMRADDVRVISLYRSNRIKQALAEYRRLYSGLGQFKAARGSVSVRAGAQVEPSLFKRSLRAVERSHRLATRVQTYLTGLQLLSVSYEQLLDDHKSTIVRIRKHLGLTASVGRKQLVIGSAEPPHAADGRGVAEALQEMYRKATPDRLCQAVQNYVALCAAYRTTEYATFFDEPCTTACV